MHMSRQGWSTRPRRLPRVGSSVGGVGATASKVRLLYTKRERTAKQPQSRRTREVLLPHVGCAADVPDLAIAETLEFSTRKHAKQCELTWEIANRVDAVNTATSSRWR